MKIAFPTRQDKGMESEVHSHFGSAPRFIIVETASGVHESVVNSDADHEHGGCQPMVALGGRTVDAVVVGGIGAGALLKLQAAGVKTYRAVEGTVAENLRLIASGTLPLFAPEHTCAGHTSPGGCMH
jgi:predicted Fe-Mo cluster-binding NifX family protein